MPPPGAYPGELALPETSQPLRITVLDYGPSHCEEREITDVESLTAYRERDSVTWVNVQGLGDEARLRRIAEIFSIHPLALADAVNVGQRPKFESYELHHFLIARMAEMEADDRLGFEQVSIVFAKGYVVMFQEDPGDCFDPVRARIRSGAPVRHAGADFLAYALLDCLIDNFFPVIETLGEHLERLEDEVMMRPTRRTLGEIQRIRRSLLLLHRTAWQQRDAANAFMREEKSHFTPAQQIYLRDAYDHAAQAIDTIETYRELTVGLMDIYLSSISNRMNEVMKVLTIIGSFFIPLTFVVGVYGMNFEDMPELHQPWGYPAVWVVMILIALAMYRYFYRKGWISIEDIEEIEGRSRTSDAEPRPPSSSAGAPR
ncbi:MAG: magnesium/cobalt transporter CorA [Deltaproteobacteria bacterium]|nr:magnesium/cobalt transporter CorA [Deltaproteobacteria bacterium]